MGENLSDALKMGAAMLLFVLALSTAIYAFSRAKNTAETTMKILDGTPTYYDQDYIYLNYNDGSAMQNKKIKVNQQEIVDKSQFISNLFNYYKSNNTILFYYVEDINNIQFNSNGDICVKLTENSKLKPLILYYSESNAISLNKSVLRVDPSNYNMSNPSSSQINTTDNCRAIYGLDITDEITRNEPWSHSQAFDNKFLEDLVMAYNKVEANGNKAPNANETARKYVVSDNNNYGKNIFGSELSGTYTHYYYYLRYYYTQHLNGKSFMDSNCRFIERIGTYNYETSSDIPSSSTSNLDDYGETLDRNYNETIDASQDVLSNGETIDNNKGAEKKIIQYIYIGNSEDIYNK